MWECELYSTDWRSFGYEKYWTFVAKGTLHKDGNKSEAVFQIVEWELDPVLEADTV